MEKSLVDIDSYFNTDTHTAYVVDYVNALVDAILPVWERYESGLLFTALIAQTRSGDPQGSPVRLKLGVSPGALIATRMFKGIPDEYSIPPSFYQNTPHMQHLLKAIDYGMMFTMMRWASLYSFSNVEYQSSPNGLLVGAYTPVSPGVTVGQLPANDLAFNEGSSSLRVASEFYKKTRQFILDRAKFPKKTEFLLDFLDKFSKMWEKSVENWVNSRTIYGGQVVLIYGPGSGQLVPILVAQRVKRAN